MNSLSPRQRRAAQFIAAGHTHRQAASAAKVTPQTVSGWASRMDFRQYVQDLIAAGEEETSQALAGLRRRAIFRLGELLDHSSASIALRAIDSTIGLAEKCVVAPISQVNPEWESIIARIKSNEAASPGE